MKSGHLFSSPDQRECAYYRPNIGIKAKITVYWQYIYTYDNVLYKKVIGKGQE